MRDAGHGPVWYGPCLLDRPVDVEEDAGNRVELVPVEVDQRPEDRWGSAAATDAPTLDLHSIAVGADQVVAELARRCKHNAELLGDDPLGDIPGGIACMATEDATTTQLGKSVLGPGKEQLADA